MLKSLTIENVTVILSLVGGIASIVVGGIIKIMGAISENRKLMVAGQNYSILSGKARDSRIKEIHILVNSRLTTALRLIVTMARKEYERTKLDSDRLALEEAEEELRKAEESAQDITSTSSHPDETETELAHVALTKLQEKK